MIKKSKQELRCVYCGQIFLGYTAHWCSQSCHMHYIRSFKKNNLCACGCGELTQGTWKQGHRVRIIQPFLEWNEIIRKDPSLLPQWKGGKKLQDGYVYVRIHGHKQRYIHEARLLLGATSDRVVHHKNHIKTDNSPENIILVSRQEHSRLHRDDKSGRFEKG